MLRKVFCIGFHKTGTKSLGAALRSLGYRVTGPNGTREPDIAEHALTMAAALSHQYDAFQDNPWPLFYREMDAMHPGSRFVLTVRPSNDWIRSAVGHFGRNESPMRRLIYGPGAPLGNEELYVARYERHNSEVADYFRHRPEDLLVMDLAHGDGWARLAPFLGVPVVQAPFPHRNPAGARMGKT